MIDKDQLYEMFQKSTERNQKLMDLATRKALDLPVEDEVNITTTKGISGGVALSGLLGGASILSVAAIVIAYLLSGQPVPQQPAQTPEVQFTVEHFDQHGEPIYVAPVERKP